MVGHRRAGDQAVGEGSGAVRGHRYGVGSDVLSMWHSHTELLEKAEHFLHRVALAEKRDTVASTLPHGDQRKLEVAILLALEPEVFMFDEPTAGMGHEDVDRVTRLIKEVSRGRTVLMVEHNMNVVSGISDVITVLQRGAILAEGPYAEVSRNADVMEAYMGTAHG